MNTFLPEKDFALVATRLDTRRLVKQIVEVKQILDAIEHGGAWSSHPIVTMWRPYVPTLAYYGLAICAGYSARFETVHKYQHLFEHLCFRADIIEPKWLTPSVIHSHRAALVYKHPAHYKQFYPDTAPALNYVWWHPDIGHYRGRLSEPETIERLAQ